MAPVQIRPSPFIVSYDTPNNLIVNRPNGDIHSLSAKKVFNRLPRYILLGDSLAAQSSYVLEPTSMTSVGTTVTVTLASHGLNRGQLIVVDTEDNTSGYDGIWRIASVPTSSTFTYTATSTPAVTPATGWLRVISQSRLTGKAWGPMASFMAGGKGLFIGNFAVGGSTTAALSTQITRALSTDNNEYGLLPDFAFINTGINDYANAILSDTTISNVQSAISTLVSNDITPILLTQNPLSSTHALWAVAYVQESRKYNEWLKANAESLGAIVLDTNTLCLDTTTQYGNWITDYDIDAIHFSMKGAYKVAQKVKTDVWDDIIVTDDPRTFTHMEPNQSLTGTGGTKGGTGTSGDVANSMTLTASGGGAQTAVGSKGIGITGDTESQRVVFTPAANNDTFTFKFTSSKHASLVEGDKLIARARIRVTGDLTNIESIKFQQIAVMDGLTRAVAGCGEASSYKSWGGTDLFDMFYETPIFKVPAIAGITDFNLNLIVLAKGTGVVTLDISQFELLKLA